MMLHPAVKTAPLVAILATSYSQADHSKQEEVLVTSRYSQHTINIAQANLVTPDSASLLKQAPGANANNNGPLTGIAQYRGMYGQRVHTSINGAKISSGGPNAMDSALSYAPTELIETIEIYRGIAPVSAGQETIGGAINVKTHGIHFGSNEDPQLNGRASAGYQSANKGSLVSAMLNASNQHHGFKLAALTEQGDDAQFDGGEILPSEYDRQRYDIAYGYQRGQHRLQLDVAHNKTGDTGTPALPMDIDYIDSDLASINYSLSQDDFTLNSRIYYSDIEHGMTNFHLRSQPMDPMMYRRNIATGENIGFKIDAKFVENNITWLMGFDSHNEKHNANIDNPNNPAFFVVGFNNAQRKVQGVFLEQQQQHNEKLSTEFGLRYNRVDMDADEVDGTPAMMTMMGMAPGMMLRDNFNGSDRSHTDYHLDWVAKLNYQINQTTNTYAGLASKTRSASYQERYLWLPLEATGGLADGNTYTGNLALDAETSKELELGLDYTSTTFSIAPRIFYRKIDDYIQGTATSDMNASMFVSMMNMMNGTNNAAPLQFNNVDAEIYGADLNWHYQIDDRWSLSGIVNYVRGKRKDINDNLYRIAPANTSVAVNYQGNNWGATLEAIAYDEQDNISETNREQKTAGYGLLNARANWQATEDLRIGFGINNISDKRYQSHLGGYNRVMNNADIAVGERLYGYGRNVFLRADLSL